ncbi:putative acyl--CoA ligase YhfT [compost metagenome]
MQSLYSGATFHIFRHFNAQKVLELCQQFPNVILFVVPTMIEAMMQLKTPGHAFIQALISSGGKWSETSINKCREIFVGTKLYEFYGSSESSYISYVDVTTEDRIHSVGKPFPSVETSIRDEYFQEVPTGENGQLFVRSELMFLGYHQRPEETSAVFRDGWLMTGDYMYKDKDGFLYLVGRTKNRMVSGGFNVFPEEIESVLQQLPAIEEVMVLGVPDDYWGEKITVLVKWSGQQRLSLEQMKDYCRKHLAHYKAPRELITVDLFIYTSSGKIARQAMKDYMKRVMI